MLMNATNLTTCIRLRRRQKGVSIVEALVAVVILSVGMLGIAGLYLESIRANRSALSRTTSVQLVNDMADRIRANRGGLDEYELDAGSPPSGGEDCAAAACSPAELALFDKVRWHESVVANLPNGPDGNTPPRTSIVYTAATADTPAGYVVMAEWLEAGNTEFLSTTVEVMQLGVN
jgi:type IV pilus assembly protein PilV